MATKKTKAKGLTASEGRITVYLDPDLRRALRMEAARRDETQSEVIAWALAKAGVKPEPARKRRA